LSRLQKLTELIGKDRLVIDLSCRAKGQDWYVATNKWQTLTTMKLSKQVFDELQEYCCEFLIHAADVEGLCSGIDERLVKRKNKPKCRIRRMVRNTYYLCRWSKNRWRFGFG
jgi:phosphoribosylformimino-5-aminoimidazole carboxamide ribotide isomerase